MLQSGLLNALFYSIRVKNLFTMQTKDTALCPKLFLVGVSLFLAHKDVALCHSLYYKLSFQFSCLHTGI